jgi:hypothetical protein
MNKHMWITAVLCAFLALTMVSGAPLNGGDPNCDDANTVSDLSYMVDFLFRGGPAPCEIFSMLEPVAAGVITPAGLVDGGTGNITCVWNSSGNRYEITITGETYAYRDYITHVTPLTAVAMASTGSLSGKLVVQLYDTGGATTQAYFAFSTFRLPAKLSSAAVPSDRVQPEPQ